MMAVGDDATAAGLPLVSSSTGKVKDGATEINRTRDFVAQEGTARAAALAGKANASHTHSAADVTSGTLDAARVPDLPASKITSGTLSASRLPSDLGDRAIDRADGPTFSAYTRSATGSGWYAVYMNSSYQFMRNTSSRRYKQAVKALELTPELRAHLLKLRPVTYHRKGQPEGTREIGLIAEDCVDVPGLVSWDVPRDRKGKPIKGRENEWRPEAVRYDQVLSVYLLGMVQDLQGQVTALQQRLDGDA
jgi:hypothetical protein